MANAKRKPKGPIKAIWLLELADSPDQYVGPVDDARGCADCSLAMGSLRDAELQAEHQGRLYDIMCVPVKFDVTRVCL